ncbi:CAP domain-containing protein [Metabacillus litoralis]|uniref:CAP domain-containing protein n=1 Tax=Metabacillus litoralis TaxID=152268 RepID=UPI003EC07C7A
MSLQFTHRSILLFIMICILLSPLQVRAEEVSHTVKKGETLWSIAQSYQVGLSEILASNNHIDNPHLIFPGQKLHIPQLNEIKLIEKQVITLTNLERKYAGLPPLKINWELSRVARYKSKDMKELNYFSHDSPTYGSPFTMINNFKIPFRTAAENLAAGQRTPKEVVNAWMNSQGHRANILKKEVSEIGVGYVNGGEYGHYWTQMFISR